MTIEAALRQRVDGLVSSAARLKIGNTHGNILNEPHRQECSAWLTAAQSVVHVILPKADHPYRLTVDRVATAQRAYHTHNHVGELAAVLQGLLTEIDGGLIGRIADSVRAETFDDFLDHAEHYAKQGKKNESGIIAGVVFEDTLRRICRKFAIDEKGKELDTLISALTNQNHLSAAKAKRARAAAHVRTKATHAQFDEFELSDVLPAIQFTRELVAEKLES